MATAAQRRAQRQRNNAKPDGNKPKPSTKQHVDKAPHMRQAARTSNSNTGFFSMIENHPLPFVGIFASITFMIVYFTRGSSRPPVGSIVNVPPDDASASAYTEEVPEEEPEEKESEEPEQPVVVGVQEPSDADLPESPPVDLISACGFRQHPDL